MARRGVCVCVLVFFFICFCNILFFFVVVVVVVAFLYFILLVFVSVCLFVCLFVYLFVCLFVYLFVFCFLFYLFVFVKYKSLNLCFVRTWKDALVTKTDVGINSLYNTYIHATFWVQAEMRYYVIIYNSLLSHLWCSVKLIS